MGRRQASFFLCLLFGCKIPSLISLRPCCCTCLAHQAQVPDTPLPVLLVLIAAWSLGVGTGRGRECGVWHRASIPILHGVSELRKRRLSTIIKTCRARFSPILEGEHEPLAWGTETIAGPLLEVQEAGGSSGLLFYAVYYPGNQGLASTVRDRELA